MFRNSMNYYTIIPVVEVHINMLKEAYTSIYGNKQYSSANFEQYIDNLRVITDTDVSPNVDYMIIKLTTKFPLNFIGYKKFTLDEINVELANSNWKHNQE